MFTETQKEYAAKFKGGVQEGFHTTKSGVKVLAQKFSGRHNAGVYQRAKQAKEEEEAKQKQQLALQDQTNDDENGDGANVLTSSAASMPASSRPLLDIPMMESQVFVSPNDNDRSNNNLVANASAVTIGRDGSPPARFGRIESAELIHPTEVDWWTTTLWSCFPEPCICIEVVCCHPCNVSYQMMAVRDDLKKNSDAESDVDEEEFFGKRSAAAAAGGGAGAAAAQKAKEVEAALDEMNPVPCLAVIIFDVMACGLGTVFASMIIRNEVRDRYNIGEEQDRWETCHGVCCFPCSLCQTHRELKYRGRAPNMFLGLFTSTDRTFSGPGSLSRKVSRRERYRQSFTPSPTSSPRR